MAYAFKNDQCLKCHRNILYIPNKRGTMLAHRDVLVKEYNEVYFKPARKKQKPEWDLYELWHYAGRRARMGAAMMAPGYAWWHGFYECKKDLVNFMHQANKLIEHNQKAFRALDFPNATGTTERPREIFPEPKNRFTRP